MRTRAFILAIGLLLARTAAGADTKVTDLSGFIDDIAGTTARLQQADAVTAGAIAEQLPAGWRVRQGQEELTVSSGWLVAPLRHAAATTPTEWTEMRTILIARLTSLQQEATHLRDANDMAASGAAPPAAAAHTALRDVLARREFHQGEQADWSEELRRRIRRWVGELLDGLPIGRTTTAVSKVFAWAIAIGAVIALAVYLYRMRLPRREQGALVIEAPRLTSTEWAARAYAALRAGDAREAMHCGYHAVLYRLEEQGVWQVDDARTPREYVRLLPPKDTRHAAFVDLTRRFEQTWYGSRAADGPGLLSHLEAFGCSAPSKPAI